MLSRDSSEEDQAYRKILLCELLVEKQPPEVEQLLAAEVGQLEPPVEVRRIAGFRNMIANLKSRRSFNLIR